MGIVAVADTLTAAGQVPVAGIYPAAGSTVYTSRVAGDGFDRFKLAADGTEQWGPGNAAFDTNLYRSTVGTLRTDGAFRAAGTTSDFGSGVTGAGAYLNIGDQGDVGNTYVTALGSGVNVGMILRTKGAGSFFWQTGGATSLLDLSSAGLLSLRGSGGLLSREQSAAGNGVFFTRVSGDTQDRFISGADGKLNWGSGAGAVDTDLYRSGAGQLKTDGQLVVVGTIFGANGGFNIAAGTYAGGTAVGGTMSYGTGAPVNANGANGDFYFRVDGAALSTIYQRRAGAWVGIV